MGGSMSLLCMLRIISGLGMVVEDRTGAAQTGCCSNVTYLLRLRRTIHSK